MDNETAGNFLDGASNCGKDSKGSIDNASVKRKRKRRCKSCKSRKCRSQKGKIHGIANLENCNRELLDVAVDGIYDEAEEMVVDDAGAEEVIDEIMNVEIDNVSIEEFMEDLPIQDELEEEFQLNDMD